VFIGGSRELSVVLPLLARRNVRTIVLNAVKLDTIHAAITLMRDLGIFQEAINVQVSHAGRLGTDYMWRPANPVTIIVGGAAGC
jgi:cobalt-precorrin-6B (C15)-methyltransferase